MNKYNPCFLCVGVNDMIKFVIVDDDVREIEKVKSLIHEVVSDAKILSFSKITSELKAEIQNADEHKIYVLDIQLANKVSGITIAKLIREVDWESEIIFITNHDKMFESTHRSIYEVFDFIEKFHDFDKRFKKDIREIIKRNFDNKMFKYDANNIELNIYYRNILYIYRDKDERKLVIVTPNNNYKISISIKDMLSYLDDRFVQCHRSCIVNKNRVEEKNYKEGYFVLDTGDKVYLLSKMNKKLMENE